jgi:hypothetical protein
MRSRLLLVVVALGSGAVAHAEDARPRAIWLECKAPAVWPAKAGTLVRLTCRVDAPVTGPAFWQTVNPFRPDRTNELLDPFDPVPRYVDLFEVGRYSRPRTIKVTQPSPPDSLSDELMSPFEAIPESAETLNPFEPQREEPQRPPR